MNKYELIINYISKYEHIKGQNKFNVNYCLNSGLAEDELLLTGEAIKLYCSNFKYFEESGLREKQKELVTFYNELKKYFKKKC